MYLLMHKKLYRCNDVINEIKKGGGYIFGGIGVVFNLCVAANKN